MTSRAETQIEAYINVERHKVLLDVAKHALSAMIGSGEYDGTYEEYAHNAADFAEALIKEVESR